MAAAADASSLAALKALLADTELPQSLVIAGDLDSTLHRFLKASLSQSHRRRPLTDAVPPSPPAQARQGNVEKAHAMLVACLKWRIKEETAR